MPLTGHCLCKAVTYTADVEAPALTGYDHCDDCQRQSGSTYCTPKVSRHTHQFAVSPQSDFSNVQPSSPSSPKTSSPSTAP